MGLQIQGPSNSISAEVNRRGQLETFSTVLPVAAYSNYRFAGSYTLTDTITPSPSADFLYIKNRIDIPLIIVATEFWCETDEKIMLYRNPIGTPTNGTDLQPENCNFGSNQQAGGIFYYGEDIGGLSNGGLRNIVRLQAGVPKRYQFDNWTILTRNTSIRFYADSGGSELDFWVQFFFLPEI